MSTVHFINGGKEYSEAFHRSSSKASSLSTINTDPPSPQFKVDNKMSKLSTKFDTIIKNTTDISLISNPTCNNAGNFSTPPPTTTSITDNYYDGDVYIPPLSAPSKTSKEITEYAFAS